MQKLANENLLALHGGRDVPAGGACVIYLTEMIIFVGVGFFAGGMVGAFALGMALSTLKSASSPC